MHQLQRDRNDLTMSRCVLAVLKEKVTPVAQFVENFLPTVIKYLEHENEDIALMWTTTLIEAIPLLPVEVLQSHIAPVVFLKFQPVNSLNLRLISCRILGELTLHYSITDEGKKNLATHSPILNSLTEQAKVLGQRIKNRKTPQLVFLPLTPPGHQNTLSLKKDLLPVCLALCQDVNPKVRAAACSVLERVVKKLRGETFKSVLGPSLVELGSDEAITVKEAAFSTAVNILNDVEPDDVLTILIPLLVRIIEHGFSHDVSLLPSIFSRFGDMCFGIQYITEQKAEFVKYFIAVAGLGLPPIGRRGSLIPKREFQIKDSSLTPAQNLLCRQAAAANLLAMFIFCERNPELVDELIPVLEGFCCDPSFPVRNSVANSIVQIAKRFEDLKPTVRSNFIKLLNDDAEEVLASIMPHLTDGIQLFAHSQTSHRKIELSVLSELSLGLLKCERSMSTSRNWRLYCAFLDQIKILVDLFPPELVYIEYTTLLLKRMHQTRTVPVRSSLMTTVLHFLRHTYVPDWRKNIVNSIINDFCKSTNFYNRIYYMRSCSIILDMFSTAYFRKYFLASTLSLVDDAVPNIRLALVKLLPQIGYIAVKSHDDDLIKLLSIVHNKLSNDKDKEIVREMGNCKADFSEEHKCFTSDAKKFVEEAELGEHADIVLKPTTSQSASRIPRFPSSISTPTFESAVLRKKREPNVKKTTLDPVKTIHSSENENTQDASSKRSIPVLRAPKSQSAPNSRQSSFKDKRLSLDEINMNKNLFVRVNTGLASPQKPSQLPRPLSCINFATARSNVCNKKSNMSKLPVSRFNLANLDK